MLPFSADQFLDVFEGYHAAWPHAAAVLTGLALLAAIFAAGKTQRLKFLPGLILSMFWIWSGAVYHLAHFTAINPAAYIFGLIFVIQGLILGFVALTRPGFYFEYRNDFKGIVGAVLVLYAIVLYPLIGSMLGHSYPRAPSFGLPCPVTIFTFGMLLWHRAATRWYVLVIPVLWVLIGSMAAIFFGIWQDLGLSLALGACIVVTLRKPFRPGLYQRPD